MALDPVTLWCEQAGLPPPELEYRFAPPRRWRFDYSWPARLVAMEVDGGLYVAGRHSRGAGREKDMEKLNEAVARGWHILTVSPRMLRDGRAFALLERVLRAR